MTETPNVTIVPFSKLTVSDEINARAATKDGLDELAASIAAKGLIQPLAVRAAGDSYEVIDGRRRHAALSRLVKAKTFAKSHAVPVIVRTDDDTEALETSLMANTVRLPMHPVDQYAVFARLAADGKSDGDIAAHFGIAEKTVRQHKALGNLAPAVRDAWKKGKLDAKAAQAFTLAPSHQVQEATLTKLTKQKAYGGIQDWAVRQELAVERVPAARSYELKLVGEKAYAKAGGTISESLFDDERLIDDVPLLKTLARQKIKAECDKLLAAGWSFALPSIDNDDPQEYDYESVLGEDGEFAAAEKHFTADHRAASGCLVSIGYEGKLEIFRGLVPLKEDASFREERAPGDDDHDESSDSEAASPAAEDSDPAAADPFKVSGALTYSLSEVLTIAAAKTLATDPALGLYAAIAALSCERFGSKPVTIKAEGFEAVRSKTGDDRTFAEALNDACSLPQASALASLSELVAGTLDLRGHHADGDEDQSALLSWLDGETFTIAARAAFNATDYFTRAPKATAEAALQEMRDAGRIREGDLPVPGSKKPAIAEIAARCAAEWGWLPPMLRHQSYALLPIRQQEQADAAAA